MKAISPLIESFVLRAQTENRVSCFRLTIRKEYNLMETQMAIWKETELIYSQFIRGLKKFDIYCAFVVLSVYTNNLSRKVEP